MARYPQALWLLLLFFAAAPQHASAAGAVCSSGIYALFAPLSTNAQVQQFCTSSYPVLTISTSTVISTTTVTAPPARRGRKREAFALPVTSAKTSSPSPTKTSSPTPAKTSSTTTTATKSTSTAIPALISSLEAEAKSVISTFCSCIESTQTKASTVTSVSTTTVTPVPTCAAPSVNAVFNGGFETGSLATWADSCGGSVVSGGDNSDFSYYTANSYCDLYQSFIVQPGVPYTVTYNYMITASAPSSISPTVADANGNDLTGYQTEQVTCCVALNTWLSGISFSFTSDTPAVKLDFSFAGDITFYMDNIVVSC